MNLDSVLVAGLNCRPAALSAKKLGLSVYVVDYFGDVDLTGNVDRVYNVGEEYSSQWMVEKAVEVAGEIEVEGIILTSELGCNPAYIKELEQSYKIIGNGSETAGRVRDWKNFFGTLDELGVGYPETVVARKKSDVEYAFDNLEGLLLAKPVHGSGGFGIKTVSQVEEAREELERQGEMLLQEQINGVDASTSLLCGEGNATAISLNEQLIGRKDLGCESEFGYCGNIVPLAHKLKKECFGVSELVCEHFGLRGSVGLDFVLEDKPYLVEVNPRVQDTLECVEKSMKVNLIKHHINACMDKLEIPKLAHHSFWCKGILYAQEDCIVGGDLTKIGGCVDIPESGRRIQKGRPVCSILSYGRTKNEALERMKSKIGFIRNLL